MAISTLGFHQSNFDTLKMLEQVGLQHLVIVDTGVENYQQLQLGWGDKAEFLVLHSRKDGIVQITVWLQGIREELIAYRSGNLWGECGGFSDCFVRHTKC